MSGNPLTDEQRRACEEVYREWMAEIKTTPEDAFFSDDYKVTGFDCHEGTSLFDEMHKKYMRRILEIKETLSKEGDFRVNSGV